MTPFDPAALLAMLLTFYPTVSSGELARARRDRPDYFAGGTLFGSKGDKLRLPDGRVFDLIFAAGGAIGQQRWQVIEVTGDAGRAGDLFPLEPGPLVPLEDDPFPPAAAAGAFEAILGDALDTLGASDGVLHGAAQAVATFAGAQQLADSYARMVEPATDAHAATRRSFDADDPAALIDRSNDQGATIDDQSGRYNEEAPADLPADDPGDPPRDDDGGRPDNEPAV